MSDAGRQVFEAHATCVACVAGATTVLVGHMIPQMCGIDELGITLLTLVLEIFDANMIHLKATLKKKKKKNQIHTHTCWSTRYMSDKIFKNSVTQLALKDYFHTKS